MKLNLASGQHYIPGYINIDNKSMYHGNMQIDKEADVFTLEWEDNTVDEIYCSLNELNKTTIAKIRSFSNSNNIILKLIPIQKY